MPTISVILVIFGVIYVIKPDIFRRGIWRKTAVTQQIFSEKNYLIYMRVLGVVAIVAGIIIWVYKK
jgi:uncharacterized protein YjeT (DUF2065 family)